MKPNLTPSFDAPRAQTVHRLAQQERFTLLGIAPARPSEHGPFLKDWLTAGKHGEMAYLGEHVEQRLDPTLIVPEARSIICVADAYAWQAPEDQGRETVSPDAAMNVPGRIARYAWRRDYHRDLKKRLHNLADAMRGIWPEHTFRTTVDTAPVLEREHAQRAGLGWVGKHTLLIHPTLGSWFLLGEIITTLPLQTSIDAAQAIRTNHCGQCTRCIQACPTQAITPYSVDASRCVSYLTLEHRGPIDPSLHEGMGTWIAGCDICQEVCPFNQEPAKTETARIDGHVSLPLLEVMNWDIHARQAALQGSALKRIKLDQFKRNAIIAAGNYIQKQPGDEASVKFRQRIAELAHDAQESDLVRLTASQVLNRLQARAAASGL